MPVKGFTETVISRGKVIIDKGRYIGRAGDGAFVSRGPYGGLHSNSQAAARKDVLGARSFDLGHRGR